MNHPHVRRNNDSLAWPSPSRRAIITGGALGLAALALAGCEKKSPLPAPSGSATAKNSGDAQGLTTLDARIVAGDKLNPKKPYRRLALDDPQKMVVREDLYRANAKRSAARKGLVAFGHITDTHIMDPTSPAQTALAFLKPAKALADKETAYFRPQDSLTIQVMDAMIRRLNAVRHGPATGRLFDFYISTGDASDNRGTNEVHAFIETLNGEKTSAFAFPGNPTSLQSPISLPEALGRFIWQPVPPKGNSPSRVWQDKYGFPVAKRLLSRASELVSTEGANVPWYSGFGNHDQLAHGGVSALETPIENYYAAMATSDKLIVGLPKGDDYKSFVEKMNSSTQPKIKEILKIMPGTTVRASSERRPLSKTEFMSAHWVNPGPHGPSGHGFTADNVRKGTAYYRFQVADGIIGLMLDTTDPTGGKGSIDTAQAAWLDEELAKVSSVSYDTHGRRIHQDVQDQMVVLFSHHPSSSFGPLRNPSRDKTAITSPQAIHELLGRFPNVILWLNGHYHGNSVWPRKSPVGNHAFWEINTASHIDFPQQSRTVEIVDNNDGTLSIAGVMVDHSEPFLLDYSQRFTAAQLAAFSAELALNRPGMDGEARTAATKSQNVELLLKKPF